MAIRGKKITIDVDAANLDTALEKANRLVELLREASTIIDSLTKGDYIKNLVSE